MCWLSYCDEDRHTKELLHEVRLQTHTFYFNISHRLNTAESFITVTTVRYSCPQHGVGHYHEHCEIVLLTAQGGSGPWALWDSPAHSSGWVRTVSTVRYSCPLLRVSQDPKHCEIVRPTAQGRSGPWALWDIPAHCSGWARTLSTVR